MTDKPRVIVVHPGGQYVPRVVEALDRAGLLQDHVSLRSLSRAERLAYYAALGAGQALLHDESAYLASRIFDRLAAPKLRFRHFDLLIGYEVACLESFRLCARRGFVRVLDHAAEHWKFQRRVFEQEWRQGRPSRALSGLALHRCERVKEEELRLADALLTLSSFARETFIADGLDSERIHQNPLGVDLELFQPKETYRTSGRLRILFSGSVISKKGVPYLLDAYRQLEAEDIELTLVGTPGSGRDVSPGMLQGVRHVPRVDQATLPDLYREADLLVLPSLMDSFGMVVLESMACGTPVLVSSHVGAADIVREAIDGFIVPPADAKTLAARLRWCIENRSQLAVMGRNARLRATQFGWSRHSERLVEIVRRIWANSKRT